MNEKEILTPKMYNAIYNTLKKSKGRGILLPYQENIDIFIAYLPRGYDFKLIKK